MFDKLLFQAQFNTGQTIRLNTADGMILDSCDANIGTLKGKVRTVPAILCDGASETEQWKILNVVDSNGMFLDHVAIKGAVSDDQAYRLCAKYLREARRGQLNSPVEVSNNGLKTFLDSVKLPSGTSYFLEVDAPLLDAQGTVNSVQWDDEGNLVSHSGRFSQMMLDAAGCDIEGQLLEQMTPRDIVAMLLDDTCEVISRGMFDAMIIKYNQFEKVVQKIAEALKASDNEDFFVKTVTPIEPFKRQGVVNVGAIFEMSDTQTITVLFNNPDTTPAKLSGTDILTSWKWILNKRDVTAILQPRAVDARKYPQLATRMLKVLAKNHDRFKRAQLARSKEELLLEELTNQLEASQSELRSLQQQGIDLQTQIDEETTRKQQQTEVIAANQAEDEAAQAAAFEASLSVYDIKTLAKTRRGINHKIRLSVKTREDGEIDAYLEHPLVEQAFTGDLEAVRAWFVRLSEDAMQLDYELDFETLSKQMTLIKGADILGIVSPEVQAERSIKLSAGDFVTGKFANLNKNNSVAEYRDEVEQNAYKESICIVQKAITLSPEEYDSFANSLLDDNEKIAGLGGTWVDDDQKPRDQQQFMSIVVAVMAQDRETLLIDPQQYSYARYVALDPKKVEAPEAFKDVYVDASGEVQDRSKDGADEITDATNPEQYAKIIDDDAQLTEWQDPLDSFFQSRLIETRNALRELGWTGERFKDLSKNGHTLVMNLKQVGGGANVVGVTYSVSGTRFSVRDDLKLDAQALASMIDSAAQGQADESGQADDIPNLSGDEFGEFEDHKELRAAVKQALVDMVGKSFPCPTLNAEVEVRTSGMKKIISNSADIRKLQAIAALKDLLAQAEKYEEQQPYNTGNERNIKAYHILKAPLQLDGELLHVRFVIREDDKGHYHYDHRIDSQVVKNAKSPLLDGLLTATFPMAGVSQDELAGLIRLAGCELNDSIEINQNNVNVMLDSIADSGFVLNMFIEKEDEQNVQMNNDKVDLKPSSYAIKNTNPRARKPRGTITLKPLESDQSGNYEVTIVKDGVGGQFVGTIEEAKNWLIQRLMDMGEAVSDKGYSFADTAQKLDLIIGEDVLGIKTLPENPYQNAALIDLAKGVVKELAALGWEKSGSTVVKTIDVNGEPKHLKFDFNPAQKGKEIWIKDESGESIGEFSMPELTEIGVKEKAQEMDAFVTEFANSANAANEQGVQMNNDEQFLNDVVAGNVDLLADATGDRIEQIGENLDPALESLFEQAIDAYSQAAIKNAQSMG